MVHREPICVLQAFGCERLATTTSYGSSAGLSGDAEKCRNEPSKDARVHNLKRARADASLCTSLCTRKFMEGSMASATLPNAGPPVQAAVRGACTSRTSPVRNQLFGLRSSGASQETIGAEHTQHSLVDVRLAARRKGHHSVFCRGEIQFEQRKGSRRRSKHE